MKLELNVNQAINTLLDAAEYILAGDVGIDDIEKANNLCLAAIELIEDENAPVMRRLDSISEIIDAHLAEICKRIVRLLR